jgi:glycosyltransferase involved in cell wall biosynthesis
MAAPRLKVLIIAHEFSPVQGSECAEGWNLVTRLSIYHDVTVLYASESHFGNNIYTNAVNAYLTKAGSMNGLKCIGINRPKISKFIATFNSLFRKIGPIGLPFLYFIGYKYWQKAAYNEAKRIHIINAYDLVHQLTQITYREPGYTWKLGIPFIWGPTGGTTNLPEEFYEILSKQSKILEKIRTISNYVQFHLGSRIIKANKKASLIYAFSTEDADNFKKRATGEVKLMLDAGTLPFVDTSIKPKVKTRIRGIWCGQLSDRKAPLILLKALALNALTRERIDIQIIGSGPLKGSLRLLADSLKLRNIEWIEQVSHDTVFRLMKDSDFLIHTSLREATSNVIPEALSSGIPIICHDVNGMSIAVND